jgi:hypothetical protein
MFTTIFADILPDIAPVAATAPDWSWMITGAFAVGISVILGAVGLALSRIITAVYAGSDSAKKAKSTIDKMEAEADEVRQRVNLALIQPLADRNTLLEDANKILEAGNKVLVKAGEVQAEQILTDTAEKAALLTHNTSLDGRIKDLLSEINEFQHLISDLRIWPSDGLTVPEAVSAAIAARLVRSPTVAAAKLLLPPAVDAARLVANADGSTPAKVTARKLVAEQAAAAVVTVADNATAAADLIAKNPVATERRHTVPSAETAIRLIAEQAAAAIRLIAEQAATAAALVETPAKPPPIASIADAAPKVRRPRAPRKAA